MRLSVRGYGRRYTAAARLMRDGSSFRRAWLADDAPRMLQVLLDGVGPYGDPYQVNSPNNGPYGDALVEELIPYIEGRFRGIGVPGARVIDGISTGGWVALALHVFYPDSFNGAWSFCPDPVDFRALQRVNIYDDDDAYVEDGGERPSRRGPDGAIRFTMRQELRMENVIGRGDSWTQSGRQWGAWNAVYGPRGDDGCPVPLWDPTTGVIDRDVTPHWERYYLRLVLARNWAVLAPKLDGKLSVWHRRDGRLLPERLGAPPRHLSAEPRRHVQRADLLRPRRGALLGSALTGKALERDGRSGRDGTMISHRWTGSPRGSGALRMTALVAAVALVVTTHGASTLPVTAHHGMVVASEPQATAVGRDVLRVGGSAIDAAVATAFALAVTYPRAGNLGGGGFIVYRPAIGAPVAYDFRETAPARASAEMFLVDGVYDRERHHASHVAVGVPGTVAGLHLAWSEHGRLTWRRLVEPAIVLAREGFIPVARARRFSRGRPSADGSVSGLHVAVFEQR